MWPMVALRDELLSKCWKLEFLQKSKFGIAPRGFTEGLQKHILFDRNYIYSIIYTFKQYL